VFETRKNEDQEKDRLMTSSFFWNVAQRGLVVTEVSGQLFGPIFKGQAKDCLKLEDTTDTFFRNAGS
jgi:hypothetical protein